MLDESEAATFEGSRLKLHHEIDRWMPLQTNLLPFFLEGDIDNEVLLNMSEIDVINLVGRYDSISDRYEFGHLNVIHRKRDGPPV